MTATRDQLYEQVWAKPMLAVAKEHEVSANYLARVCASLNVPWPPRGYWAKVAAGQKLPRPALPEAGPGDQLEWEKGAGLDEVLARPRRAPPKGAQAVESPQADQERLPDRHALIRGAREFSDIDRTTENGYLRPRKRLLVDIVVSRPMLQAALDWANELFLMLERHGHRVALAPGYQYCHRPALELEGHKYVHYYSREPCRPDRSTVVFVGSVVFGLTLYETSAPVEVQYIKGEYVPVAQLTPAQAQWTRRNHTWTTTRHLPTGRLALRAYSASGMKWQQEWAERKPGELLHRFRTVRRTLLQAVPDIEKQLDQSRLEAEERRREAEIQHAKWEREERERREKEAYKESREQLMAIVDRWALARRIEDFFQDAERRAAELEEPVRTQLLSRVDAARQLLGSVDALHHLSSWKSPVERIAPASRGTPA